MGKQVDAAMGHLHPLELNRKNAPILRNKSSKTFQTSKLVSLHKLSFTVAAHRLLSPGHLDRSIQPQNISPLFYVLIPNKIIQDLQCKINRINFPIVIDIFVR